MGAAAPRRAVKKKSQEKIRAAMDDAGARECPICLEEIEDGLAFRPDGCACASLYCAPCIDGWPQKANLCPTCRAPFEEFVGAPLPPRKISRRFGEWGFEMMRLRAASESTVRVSVTGPITQEARRFYSPALVVSYGRRARVAGFFSADKTYDMAIGGLVCFNASDHSPGGATRGKQPARRAETPVLTFVEPPRGDETRRGFMLTMCAIHKAMFEIYAGIIKL